MNNTFESLMNNWTYHKGNKYYFSINKCCGYSFIIPIYKTFKLSDLYRHIAHEMSLNDVNFTLHFEHEDMKNHVNIGTVGGATLSTWVNEHKDKLEIITKVPDPVVHKLWIDDGHHCDHSNLVKH